MLNLGYQEMILIAIVALVVVGPKRIPEFMRALGSATLWMKRTVAEFTREIEVADRQPYVPPPAETESRKPE